MVVNKKYFIFGQKLKLLRNKHKITQEDFCERVGCTVRTLHRWEHGKSYPLSVYHSHLKQILPEIYQKTDSCLV